MLELFLNFRFNSRMEQFVTSFKSLYQSANSPMSESSAGSMIALLQEDFDISEKPK